MDLPWKREKSLAELQEEDERKSVVLSIRSKDAEIAEKESALRQLKAQYGSGFAQAFKDDNGKWAWNRIFSYLKGSSGNKQRQ